MGKKKQKLNDESLTIVAIGASAGGLSALKSFFTKVTADSGLAFVVVVHLSPDHESHLANLLQPHVKMPVQQVQETISLEPNNVYVIPPGANLDTIDTHLRLTELEEKRIKRAPIDHFFRTLAKTHNGNAIGIILTGTGSDGTLGIRKIKERGGLIIVQDPVEAEFDGMPVSAISTGMVDLVLSLAEIPKELLRYTSTKPQLALPEEVEDGEKLKDNTRHFLNKVFTQVKSRTGRDFTQYKRSTLMRRLQRRMQINHIEEPEKYLQLIRKNPQEVKDLSDDFLINVTSFFRDPEVYKEMEEKVIPQLFRNKKPGEQIRVWSVGCATGEEAYSIAILLLEKAAEEETTPVLQVFASDLHEHSLQKAREGFFPGDIETDVSPERLKRFFTKEDSGYRIRKEVRELVVFAPHNLLEDPPFSKLDLIACRNVLIYLQREIQRDIMELFHYALLPEGFLILGTSETADSIELFRSESKQHCLYRKRNVPAQEPRLPAFPFGRTRIFDKPRKEEPQEGPLSYDLLHSQMLERNSPPSLLLGANHEVIYLSNDAGRYLSHPGGSPTTNLFRLLKEELRLEARAALHKVMNKPEAAHSKIIQLHEEGTKTYLRLSVYPGQKQLKEEFYLLIFREVEKPEPNRKTAGEKQDGSREEANVKELQTELELNQQRLLTVLEEYETSKEEMKASNEELQSANEELRSTMEELETSKEELQSVNEELSTLNQENRHKVEELGQLSSDLQNLLTATDIATIYLDKKMRILRFTPRVSELFNVRQTDRGRPISDLTHKLGYEELLNDAKKVLEKLIPKEREVRDQEGNWYLTRVLPYRSSSDHIEGVVITFIDISDRKKMEVDLRQNEEKYRTLFDSIDEAYAVVEPLQNERGEWNDFRFIEVNPAFVKQTGMEYPVGRLATELLGTPNPRWALTWGQVAETGEPIRFEESEDAVGRIFDLYAFRLHAGGNRRVAVIFTDITERKLREERQAFLLNLNDALRHLADPVQIQAVATDFLGEHLKVNQCHYGETIGDYVNIYHSYGNGLPPMTGRFRHQDFGERLIEGYRSGLIQVGYDTTTNQNISEAERLVFASAGIGAYVAVPLVKNGEWVATLAVHNKEPKQWNQAEIDLVREVAERTWAAVERARAEEALRESEEQFRLFVMASSEMVYKMNADWSQMYYLKDLKGKSFLTDTSEIISDWTLEYIPAEDQEQVQAAIKKAIDSKSVFELEHRVIRADGSTGWVASRAVPLLDDQGEIKEWFGTANDITERKQAEEDLKEAKELAEAAGKAKEEFVSTMSHEIRTPLNAVISLSHLLLEHNPRQDQQENLHALEFSAKNLLALINDILDFSKLEAGKATLSEDNLDLHDLLCSLRQSHQPKAEENNTKIKLTIDEQIPDVIVTDQLKLSQILNNLVSNAVKFTKKGEVHMEVSLDTKEDEIYWLNFSIKDTGIGISKNVQKQVFEKFTQADSSTAGSYGGTGLGLSITKLLLELMGSEIKIESEPEKGSRFFFNLPVKKGKPEEGLSQTNGKDKDAKQNLQNLKLLLVEDVEINRNILLQFFWNWWEFKPDEATNGKEAVDKATQKRYDIILMDIRMPVMDGFEATKQIRKLKGYKETPILALTADQNKNLQQIQREIFFNDLLSKPFDPTHLKQKILYHLDRSNYNFKIAATSSDGHAGADEKISSKFSGDQAKLKSVNLSRYLSLAGDNREVLNKLVDNSLKAIEAYKKEFSVAAKNKDADALADLVHKNTTTVFYIQANQLEEKISRYREILKSAKTEETLLEKHRKEAISEFKKVIKDLKDFLKS